MSMNQEQLKKWLQGIILIACMAFIVNYFTKHSDELNRVAHLSAYHIILLLLMSLFIHLLVSYKMLFILKKMGTRNISSYEWLKIFTTSRFLNFHLLQGGNIHRSVILKKNYDFSYTKSISLLTFIGWIEVIYILTIGACAVFIIDRPLAIYGIDIFYIVLLMIGAALLAPFLANALLKKAPLEKGIPGWIRNKLLELYDILNSNVKKTSTVIPLIGFNIVIFLLYVVSMQLSFDALGLNLGFIEAAIFIAIILMSGIINTTPSNIGIMEILCGYASQLFGWGLGAGIIACSILRIMGYLLVVFLTLIWMKHLLSFKYNE